MNDAFTAHREVLGFSSFTVYPQPRLSWDPSKTGDSKHIVPDFALGRLAQNGMRFFQGGAEIKPALPVMTTLPSPEELSDHDDLKLVLAEASVQACDQVKAAVKSGHLPSDEHIHWLIGVGPYFAIRQFGPFSLEELTTRGHRPNDSGDFGVLKMLEKVRHEEKTKKLAYPLYRIGTQEGAVVLHKYLQDTMHLYDRMMC